TGNGLVGKEYCRFAHQLKPDVQPLTLTPADLLVQRVSHHHVTIFIEVKLSEYRDNHFVKLLLVIIAEGETSIIIMVLVNCQLLYQEIILGDITNETGKLLLLIVKVIAIYIDSSVLRIELAIKNIQECALSHTAATHDSHQVTRLDTEAHGLYAVVRPLEVIFKVVTFKEDILNEIGPHKLPE